MCFVVCFFFFFQAEDGIRDHCVTGVQTCALPICIVYLVKFRRVRMGGIGSVVVVVSVSHQNSGLWFVLSPASMVHQSTTGREVSPTPRSEERRVGKECRSRWSPYH